MPCRNFGLRTCPLFSTRGFREIVSRTRPDEKDFIPKDYRSEVTRYYLLRNTLPRTVRADPGELAICFFFFC